MVRIDKTLLPPFSGNEQTLFHLGFSDNERHAALIKMLVRDGVALNGTINNEDNIPKLKLKEQGRVLSTQLILLPKVMHFLLNYLYTGDGSGFPSYLSNGEIPEYRSEDNYIFRHIKREIERSAVVFTEEEQGGIKGVRVKATYPYGSLDYGFYPNTQAELLVQLEEVEPFCFERKPYEIPDLHNHSLPIELKDLPPDTYLNHIFSDHKIPTNTIVDKTICGIGATHMEINAPRHSIIVEPNVPVIIGKKQQHPQIIAVFGDRITAKQIAGQIKAVVEGNGHVKIMTTPDSFPKIISALKSLYTNYTESVFLLFDECEKFITDIDFRKNMILPIDDFFAFKNKAMVSATPIVINDPRFKEQNFQIIKINPLFNHKQHLSLKPTNNVALMLKRLIQSLLADTTPVCTFYNSIQGIEEIITDLGIVDQAHIYCSTDAKKTLKKSKYNVFDSVIDEQGNPNLNKVNFFTSRFYSAVDIKLPYRPTVVMVSDVHKVKPNEAPYTLIDPSTEAIQIVGRFRNGVSNTIHITNTNDQMGYLSKEQLEQFLSEQHIGYKNLVSLYKNAKTIGEKHILFQAIERSDYKARGFVTAKHEVNYFRYNNAYLDERIKMIYRTPAALNKTYQNTGVFDLYSESEYMIYTAEERKKLNDKNSPKAERINLVNDIYNRSQNSYRYIDAQFLNELKTEYGLYIEAIKEIGYGKVKALKYVDSEIKAAVNAAKFKRLTESKTVIDEVYSVLQPNTDYPTADINAHLQTIFDKYGIEYDKRGIGKYVEIYFDAQEKRTGKKRVWKLGAKKH